MYKLLDAGELLARGVSSLAQLRPVLLGNTDPLVGNATLRKDEWELIDTRVNDVMRERLSIVDDLRGRGLVTPVSVGTILRTTERMSDFDAADVSYDGDVPPTEDRPNYKRDVIPVPVIGKGFVVGFRQLDASRRRGEPLDVSAAAIAARKVRDKLESLFVNGYGFGPGANPTSGTDGQSIPGLINAAGRLTESKSASWATASTDIVGDVLKMLAKAYGANLFGPFNLYVPKNSWANLQRDYSATTGQTRTTVERIEAMADINALRPLDALPDDNIVLLQMTEDVIDLTEAQAVTTVQWDKNPWVTNFRVVTIGGPHIKSIETTAAVGSPTGTINGIVHMT